MCGGGEILSAVGIGKGSKEARRALENANVIHGRPDVEEMQRQALAERQSAEQRAADVAGMRIRAQRQAMRANSLYTGGAGGGRTSLGV